VSRIADSLRLLSSDDHASGVATSAALRSDLPLDARAVAAAVEPSVRAALRAAQPLLCAPGVDSDSELMLTVHIALCPPPGAPRVTAHACPLPARRREPIAALVNGPPRVRAAAKSSAWVAQRAPLEAERPQDCGETILTDPSTGALLEGLVNNLFVIAAVEDGGAPPRREGDTTAAAASSSLSPWHGVELRTASVAEGVLPGITRAGVLRAAARIGLRVREAAPLPGEGAEGRWREAFVCNAVRGVAPLRELRWPPGAQHRAPVLFPDAPGPVTRALVDALEAALPEDLSEDFVAAAEDDA
jgi:branched-subunit amino acid aminotransferase/4-amino-4-deoxychorismate lyase